MNGRACTLGLRLLAVGLSVATVVLPADSAACKTESRTAPRLSGSWEVVHVAVDARDQPHWYYRPDDPRLLGRELVIDESRVHLSGGSLDCNEAHWKSRKTSWGQLLGKSFRRSPNPSVAALPSPADFGSTVAKGAIVSVNSLSCAQPAASRGKPWANAWFVMQGPDTLALRLDSSALLMLVRRAATAKPRASFDCAAASTATERALCSRTDLAGLDRSVSAAYSDALERQPEAALRLREEQTAWLGTRDSCGADATCLEDKMTQRIDELVQQ